MARVFVLKVGVLPDRVLVALLNDRMVAKVRSTPLVEADNMTLVDNKPIMKLWTHPVLLHHAACICQQTSPTLLLGCQQQASSSACLTINACAAATRQGTILAFVTDFFSDFLATDNIDDLVALLKKARLEDRLLEFFPPQQRSLEQFNAHFNVRIAALNV